MDSILIDSQKQERHKSLENFRQMLEDILSKLMVSKIFAESLKHINFKKIIPRYSPLKGLIRDSLVQRSASAWGVGTHVVNAVKINASYSERQEHYNAWNQEGEECAILEYFHK